MLKPIHRRHTLWVWAPVLSLMLVLSCSKNDPKPTNTETPSNTQKPQASKAQTDHGAETPLGQLELGGYTLELSALGRLAPGEDSAVAAKVKASPQGRDWKRANLYLWAENAAGKRLNAPARGTVEEGRLHLHVSLPTQSEPATVLVFRLRDQGKDIKKQFPLTAQATRPTGKKGKQHTHEKTPHDGIMVRFSKGYAEVKLHDDKGDLELWLTQDKAGEKPLDLPLDSKIEMLFVDHNNKTVTLAPRNTTRNEGEDNQSNIRNGATNYFIFPGKTGADATWLIGKDFQSVITLSIPTASGSVTSEECVLQPHVHNADGSH